MHDNVVTAFGIAVTIVAYVVSRRVFLKTRLTLLNPVFVSTITIILVLIAVGIRGEQYKPGRELMTILLGPATVALAVPLYRQRRLLVMYWASSVDPWPRLQRWCSSPAGPRSIACSCWRSHPSR